MAVFCHIFAYSCTLYMKYLYFCNIKFSQNGKKRPQQIESGAC